MCTRVDRNTHANTHARTFQKAGPFPPTTALLLPLGPPHTHTRIRGGLLQHAMATAAGTHKEFSSRNFVAF